jgi:hypothetical protein
MRWLFISLKSIIKRRTSYHLQILSILACLPQAGSDNLSSLTNLRFRQNSPSYHPPIQSILVSVLVESPRFFREGLNEIREVKLNILYQAPHSCKVRLRMELLWVSVKLNRHTQPTICAIRVISRICDSDKNSQTKSQSYNLLILSILVQTICAVSRIRGSDKIHYPIILPSNQS